MLSRLIAAGLVCVFTVLCGSVAITDAAAVDAVEDEEALEPAAPLRLSIDQLTPAHLDAKGPIRIRGTVTNTSEEEWRAVNVLPFAGTEPITSPAGLRAAMALPITAEVGDRITAFGAYASVGDLGPGETVDFDIRVRRDLITTPEDPGAYWFGVHASGESDTTPRDGVADGKARTFLTRMPQDAEARVALVLPVRRPVERGADGALSEPRSWLADLDHGSLGHVVDFADAAGNRALTWLIDPAVVDAVRSLAADNPGRDLGPTEGPEDQPAEPEETDETEDTDGDTGGDTEAETGGAPVDPDAQAAADWLASLDDAVGGSERLMLPYGDLDVAAAVLHDRAALNLALRRTSEWAAEPEAPGTSEEAAPAVAPLNGRLAASAATVLEQPTTMLLDASALPGAGARVSVGGLTTYLATPEATAGGPGPEPTKGQVAHRQQIIAEAAVRALSGEQQTVVSLDPEEIPQVDDTFFTGLDGVPWLDLSELDALEGEVTRVAASQLLDPAVDTSLPAANFRAAQELIDAGAVLDDVLPLTDTLAADVETEALTGLSGWHRAAPAVASAHLLEARGDVQDSLNSVRAVGQDVTLSADTGRFSVTVINDLAQPVRVGLSATTDGSLEITPTDPVDIGGDSRVTRYLTASSELLGLHTVELTPTDSQGDPVGQANTIQIRASQVSELIWIVFAVGGGLIALAIVRRLVRRITGWWRAR